MFEKSELQQIKDRITEPRRFIQVIMRPRQVGKTTLVKQLLANITIPYSFWLPLVVVGLGRFLKKPENQRG